MYVRIGVYRFPPSAGGCGLPVWWPRRVCLNAIINHIYLNSAFNERSCDLIEQSTAPFIIAVGRYGDSVISASQGRWPVSHGPRKRCRRDSVSWLTFLAEGCVKNAERRGEERTFHLGCAADDWHLFPVVKNPHEPVPLLTGWTHKPYLDMWLQQGA